MTLLELINSQRENEQKYNFMIYFKDVEIINTTQKITFNQLINIIGLSLENMKIEYTLSISNFVMIEIKG